MLGGVNWSSSICGSKRTVDISGQHLATGQMEITWARWWQRRTESGHVAAVWHLVRTLPKRGRTEKQNVRTVREGLTEVLQC